MCKREHVHIGIVHSYDRAKEHTSCFCVDLPFFKSCLEERDLPMHPSTERSKAIYTYERAVIVEDTKNYTSIDLSNIWEIHNAYDRNISGNENNGSELPKEMQFTDDNMVSVVAYTCLFAVAAIGNLTIFITLFRNRNRKSRVNLFIMHLSIADLVVTFVMLPLETAWHITVAWKAGDLMCRLLMFFRAFGFYLSSFILVVISLDRYFAILHPLSMNDADKRGKIMLGLAWIFSTVASIPQSIIFHVESHPNFMWFTQCVTFNFFPSKQHELAYNLFNAISVYGLPLIIISISYLTILWKISQKTKESRAELSAYPETVRSKLRRSGVGNIAKARTRTLKMTFVIVMVFIICWTPYFVISAWFWFASDSFKMIDPKVQRGLLLFGVSNSCMDPIVYGMFTIKFKQELQRCCCCLTRKLSFSGSFPSNRQRPGHGTKYVLGSTKEMPPNSLPRTFMANNSKGTTDSYMSQNSVEGDEITWNNDHNMLSHCSRINRNNFIQCQ